MSNIARDVIQLIFVLFVPQPLPEIKHLHVNVQPGQKLVPYKYV